MGVSGIIAATFLEAELLVEMLGNKSTRAIQGKSFFNGTLNDSVVVLSICGIGKANAAHATAILFEKFSPARIFALGVAGAYPATGLDIGSVAVADREIYGDEGIETVSGFMTMDAMGLKLASTGSNNYYNEFPLFIPAELKGHKHTGSFVTVSTCTGTLKDGIRIKERFGAICENMEGAAIAHIGLLNNVPVTEIRGISNIIEDRGVKPLDKAALSLAAENVQKYFISLF
jgi:futalosine hydrolase